MGLAFQRYLVAMDDTFYRMANTAFDRMLQDPTAFRLPELAGQRVRTVELVVELVDRKPAAVVRMAFAVLAFDDTGCLDISRLRKQQNARIESALAPVFADTARDERVIDAGGKFIAQGGTWTPSRGLARAIDEVALGRKTCLRLGARRRGA